MIRPIYKIDCLQKVPWGDARINLYSDLERHWPETNELETAQNSFEQYKNRGHFRGLRLVKYTPEVLEENE